MRTLVQFESEHDGKEISGWSRSGGQCVDEVRRYMQECLNIAGDTYHAIRPGNAHSFFVNANVDVFRRIHNTPAGIPPEGAIVVLNHGDYGHVFVARAGSTVHKMLSFDQNWSRVRRCAREAHSYAECIGWLVRR